MQEVRAERLRDGAIFWGLFVDTKKPERHVEFFTLEAWLEHLRQHERVTATDRAVEAYAREFHQGGEPPVVTHFITHGQLPMPDYAATGPIKEQACPPTGNKPAP
jgi:hypothetical protein